MTRRSSLELLVQVGSGPVLRVRGREAWALQKLIDAEYSGCTPIEQPGPRWSGYVYDLRKLGFDIETVREPHGGPFPGGHARYLLRSSVTVLDRAGAAT